MLKYSPVSNKTLKSALHTGGGGGTRGRTARTAVECQNGRRVLTLPEPGGRAAVRGLFSPPGSARDVPQCDVWCFTFCFCFCFTRTSKSKMNRILLYFSSKHFPLKHCLRPGTLKIIRMHDVLGVGVREAEGLLHAGRPAGKVDYS